MPIMVPCDCGRMLNVPDEHAGKKVKCGGCGTFHNVPAGAVLAVPAAVESVLVASTPAAVRAPASRPSPAISRPGGGGLVFLRGCLWTIAVISALCFILGPLYRANAEVHHEEDLAYARYCGDVAAVRKLEDKGNRDNDSTEKTCHTAVICLTVALAGLAITSAPMRLPRGL